jgi:hypothetical protein
MYLTTCALISLWVKPFQYSLEDISHGGDLVVVKQIDKVSTNGVGMRGGSVSNRLAVLNQLGIKAGETLLVHAAAGGVGTFAVQLAVARGARVIGTAGERNFEYPAIEWRRARLLRRRPARTCPRRCATRGRCRPRCVRP